MPSGCHGHTRLALLLYRVGASPPPDLLQWEVEALEPDELQRLVLAAVAPYIDREVLAEQIAREEQQRRALADFVRGWDAAGGMPQL
ncbi:hypothetical protein [Streptomyces sp. S186]|uniref:hypothetical protein n=1 Tax=Streptomyces sp. S186 TaxID=3434395 RepID=UPI003F66A421